MANEADHAYRARLAYVRSLVEDLQIALDEDEADQAQCPHVWSFAGTMGSVGELLEQVLQKLAARPVDSPSGVPPLP